MADAGDDTQHVQVARRTGDVEVMGSHMAVWPPSEWPQTTCWRWAWAGGKVGGGPDDVDRVARRAHADDIGQEPGVLHPGSRWP